ncbi:hypothetical protein IDSA_04660 [Pseudidiomarina salinarum]|uniref:tRNA 5-carboxymethoxyuridine methyltransferase n=1 Tax=Pseudidiomarina salinarum TaxID=435908 RepID=A0A094LAT6_9GAMM|nr:methyltransferase domain-containing protein [Pseudidiomarina salinarum]KFZ31973.1 hypothetical protein IDSA_04660 [Pseudidiomarina salinarum]RUO70250.1 SAM-dependent methyltransferase [Pseudidiomarina salinarum]
MSKKITSDQSFAGIGKKFSRNIYDTAKGKIRLAVLERDLQDLIKAEKPLKVLDIGAGLGQFSERLAAAGHQVVHTDIAADMVEAAQARHQELQLSEQYHYYVAPLQELPQLLQQQHYDLVLCHAVLEWLADPESAIRLLKGFLKPEGTLSLMFYNRDAKILANVIYGNFDYVEAGLEVKKKVRLSPQRPVAPADVERWLQDSELRINARTGVRCFHDYLRNQDDQQRFEQLLGLELKYNRQSPFNQIGRYLHWRIQHG